MVPISPKLDEIGAYTGQFPILDPIPELSDPSRKMRELSPCSIVSTRAPYTRITTIARKNKFGKMGPSLGSLLTSLRDPKWGPKSLVREPLQYGANDSTRQTCYTTVNARSERASPHDFCFQ